MSSFFHKIGKIISTPSTATTASRNNAMGDKIRAAAPTLLHGKEEQRSRQQQQMQQVDFGYDSHNPTKNLKSASKAKERLSLILASQRNSTLLQDIDMHALQQDVLQVLKKYIHVVDSRNNSSSSSSSFDGGDGIDTDENLNGARKSRGGGGGRGGFLHCDVKSIPNEQSHGEQVTLLEMTVEIDARQTLLLRRRSSSSSSSSPPPPFQ